jgi:hypothetical protein
MHNRLGTRSGTDDIGYYEITGVPVGVTYTLVATKDLQLPESGGDSGDTGFCPPGRARKNLS